MNTFPSISSTALAFRGYNVTNLGRTAELLKVDSYRDTLVHQLQRFSTLCSEYVDYSVDLLRRVETDSEPGLEHYAESIALIVATEVAHLQLLSEVHGIQLEQAQIAYGYSLGELVAVSYGGVFPVDQMVRVPLAMAADSLELARNTRMGVLFSRGSVIDEDEINRLCLKITSEGKGTIGVSAVLSPNTYLLIGQNETVKHFKQVMHKVLPNRAHLRINANRWPPLHTPIARQRHIADRAAVMLETLPGRYTAPSPPVLSLVTGKQNYNDLTVRSILRKWIDHRQRLWDVVDQTLELGVETVLHIGPEPNVIPATFKRLSENVTQQTSGRSLGSLGIRAVSGLVRRPWLAGLLPSRATLLRAPHVKQIVAEDWLLENA